MSDPLPLCLASASPRRKKLLRELGLRFLVRAPRVEEHLPGSPSPEELVQELALRKARNVFSSDMGLVIGADTVVVHRGEVLEKPGSPAEAEAMLQRLCGDRHEVLTGVALIKSHGQNESGEHTFVERTQVRFGNVDNALIREYVASGSPMDKAGGYGIQDPLAGLMVAGIRGDYYNVVGFPLHAFYRQLRSHAPEYVEMITTSA
ncbi:MAG: Maf family protein [Balneolaceae bacterium]|nr:Maf family protein [Balneolaceae bacterium]